MFTVTSSSCGHRCGAVAQLVTPASARRVPTRSRVTVGCGIVSRPRRSGRPRTRVPPASTRDRRRTGRGGARRGGAGRRGDGRSRHGPAAPPRRRAAAAGRPRNVPSRRLRVPCLARHDRTRGQLDAPSTASGGSRPARAPRLTARWPTGPVTVDVLDSATRAAGSSRWPAASVQSSPVSTSNQPSGSRRAGRGSPGDSAYRGRPRRTDAADAVRRVLADQREQFVERPPLARPTGAAGPRRQPVAGCRSVRYALAPARGHRPGPAPARARVERQEVVAEQLGDLPG